MESESDAAQNLIAAIYGSVAGSSSREAAMKALTRAMDCERITLLSIGPDGTVRQDSYPFDPQGVIDYAEHYADKDVRIGRALASARSGPMSTQDLMSAEEIARCPVHNEYYRHHPECWNMLMVRTDIGGGPFAPVFHRSARYGMFSPQERRRATAIAGHLARADQIGRQVPATAIASDGIVAALDGLPDGLIVFDRTGQVQHMNAAARRLVEDADGITLHNKVPVATHPAARPLLSRIIVDVLLLAAGAAFETPASIPLPRPSGGRPLCATAYLAPPREGYPRFGILSLSVAGDWRLPALDIVRAAGDFTPAEARLAHALIAGRSLREHADANGLSEHTVRAHMKRIREKLGVSRQAEAVSEIIRRCHC
ncbi:LuxR C-terminal-related transcriptional regulator [Acuticoccus sp. M5D2P5]|uniref:helix-turn-helix transcriptional regulator n=1 Tax=Acuticoccus kalidii TaxID=2910977 RepID=UPI001F1CAB60|nr:LuxR C-terminal-related transcriptional regulator [Acuticoccus kalidii]MCF3933157.1 LuxR C-terminal-related transcriptional regulator [Acuticoccus kalidii]